MGKKKVVSLLLILTVIAALAFSVVHFFLESDRAYKELYEELHKSRVYEAYLDANDIARKLSSFTYNFYDNINELNALLRPENSKYNETKEYIIYWKCELLRTQATYFWLDISRDLMDLRHLAYLDKEISFLNTSAFENVYGVIRESLGQVDWATLGKTGEQVLNETPAFLWELYYVLGVNQVEQEPPESRLLALERCFTELYGYWYFESKYGKDNIPTDSTPPQTALEWTVGNATALHQELIQWDKYHRARLYPD